MSTNVPSLVWALLVLSYFATVASLQAAVSKREELDRTKVKALQSARVHALRRHLLSQDKGRVMFVLHDAGESLALLPVVHELLRRPDMAHRVLILPLGEPATSMIHCSGSYGQMRTSFLDSVATTCTPLPSITLSKIGIDVAIEDGTHGRHQLLSPKQLRTLTESLGPGTVAIVTGMNYEMQCQIGMGLQRANGAHFVPYYDGLSVVGTDPDANGVHTCFVKDAEKIWLPSLVLVPPSSGVNWEGVGQPTLESWEALSMDINHLRAIRARVYGEEALRKELPSIIWFGGYGAKYEEALRLWCRTVKQLHASGSPVDVLFSLAMHPGPYGKADIRVLMEEGAERIITLVPDDISGAEAALSSNLTVSQGSTGVEQSLFAGKPAFFMDLPKNSAFGTHLASMLGLVRTVSNPSEAMDAVREVAARGWTFDSSSLAASGMPHNATKHIAHLVGQLLASN